MQATIPETPANRASYGQDILRIWAALGSEVITHRSRMKADWNAVDRMIKAVHPKLDEDAKQFKRLLGFSLLLACFSRHVSYHHFCPANALFR